MTGKDLSGVRKIIEDSGSVLITGKPKKDLDLQSAIVAMALSLSSQGKDVTIAFDSELSWKFRSLLKRYNLKFVKELDPLKYVITVNNKKGATEKVSYDVTYTVDTSKFNLFITPMTDEFSFDDVTYSRVGRSFDATLVFGCKKIEELGGLYKKNSYLFRSNNVLNVSTGKLGKIGDTPVKIDTGYGYSQWVYDVLRGSSVGGAIRRDSATVLLQGILNKVQLLHITDIEESVWKKINDLKTKGGEIGKAIKTGYHDYHKSWVDLQTKVFSNIQKDDRHKTVWSTVSVYDFSKIVPNPGTFYLDEKITFNGAEGFYDFAFIVYGVDGKKVAVVAESNNKNLRVTEVLDGIGKVVGTDSHAIVYAKGGVNDVEKKILSKVKGLLGDEETKTNEGSENKQEISGETVDESQYVSPPPVGSEK